MFFNKNLAINYLACIVFLLWNFQVSQATSKEQSNTSYIIKEFFPPNTIFNHLVFEESLGYVYIGAQNRLYQLSSDLNTTVANVTVGPVKDHINCLPSSKTCEHSKSLTNNTNRLLLIDKGRNRLITCGSVFHGACITRSLSNISEQLSELPNNFQEEDIIASNIKGGTVVAVIAEGPTVNNSVFYVAATLSGNQVYYSHEKEITTRSLHYDPKKENDLFKYAVDSSQTIGSFLEINENLKYFYKYAFETGGSDGYVYFVSTRSNTKENYPFIVARICKAEPFYYSYFEVPITCGNAPSDITTAYFSPDDNKAELGTLYVLFETDGVSAVCSYTKQLLDKQFYKIADICFKHQGNENGVKVIASLSGTKCDSREFFLPPNVTLDSLTVSVQNAPLSYYKDYTPPKTKVLCGAFYLPYHLYARWHTKGNKIFTKPLTRFTAFTTASVEGFSVGFIGTSNGTILQVNLNSSLEYNEIKLNPNNYSVLPDFAWDRPTPSAVPHLYVATTGSILRIRVAACEKFSTCGKCIQSQDPYCGWCILEGRCTIRGECTTSDKDRTRWLGHDSKNCPNFMPITPVDRNKTPKKITLRVNHLPVLDSKESYRCVFNGSTSVPISNYQYNGKTANFTCSPPSGSTLAATPNNNDYMNVTVSLKYITTKSGSPSQVTVVSTNLIYYDCTVYGRDLEQKRPCAGCLSSRWSCRWCINEAKCSSSNLNPGCLADKTLCPTVTSVASETQLVPVGKRQQIKLLTSNLPTGGTAHCLFTLETGKWIDSGTNELEIEATASNDHSFATCELYTYNYTQNKQSVTAFVTFFWKLSFVVDSHSTESSSVTFYKCATDRSDCSRCVTAESKFNCGWCNAKDECTISEFCDNTRNQWYTNGSSCPALQITGFVPDSGPLNGGTLLTIHGKNMGTSVNDVRQVTVGGQECEIQKKLYEISLKIVCKTRKVSSAEKVAVTVVVKDNSDTASGLFDYRNPSLTRSSPNKGPMAGGTLLIIEGRNLNTGSNITVELIHENNRRFPCDIQGVQSSQLTCLTTSSDVILSDLTVVVTFDSFTLFLQEMFSYVNNPEVESASIANSGQFSSFSLGGRIITIRGSNFNYVQKPLMSVTFKNPSRKRRRRSLRKRKRSSLRSNTPRTFENRCNVTSNVTMTCSTPTIPADDFNSLLRELGPKSNFIEGYVDFILDRVILSYPPHLNYYPNPEFETWSTPVEKIARQSLEIKANNLNTAVTKSEVRVKIGTHECQVQSIDDNTIFCNVPKIEGLTNNQEFNVQVYINSDNSSAFDIGPILYKGVESNPIKLEMLLPIIIGVTVLFVLIGAAVFWYKSRHYKAHKNDHQKAMANMEMSVRADFLKAFAELNVDMNDVTADIEDAGIPCLDYRTYVTNLFFPSFKYHPCMKPRDQSTAVGSKLEQGLSQFHLLLSNRNFLSAFIHTLESQKNFSSREKGNVASLLTVVLHNKLDYFTEVMKSLVSDLITVNIQRNPKVILRRSESVAERLLSNWMYICLYPYLRDKAGSPIFLLLKAIKQQVSKGPVDAVTGRTRYTLSDDRLLQEDVEHQVLTLFVTADSFSEEEPVVVKVLSCDSVAQVKEKVMDAVYKRTVFSQRPKADQLDIEWRHGHSGRIVLPTDDYHRDPNSRWRRLMQISDYSMPDNATIVLVKKQHDYEDSQEISCAVSTHTESSLLTPMLPEDNSCKTYHLAKYADEVEGKRESTINRDRHKHIPEIYLLRLISMKGTLQTYVDAALHAILDRLSIPPPVKHFFDFLDDEATKHGIEDPDVLHIWKTNSLLGRFWVTMLKNPDSVFDIEKPETIASSMAVISQTFIDACSVTEHKPTKDSPINKQLYAKEIPTYKKMVQDYYKVIKEQSPVTGQEINSYIAAISRDHNCEFDANVALKELWGYLNKYYEEINENLDDDPALNQVKAKLEQTYDSIESA